MLIHIMQHDKGITEGRKQRYLLYTYIHNRISRKFSGQLLGPHFCNQSQGSYPVFVTTFLYLVCIPFAFSNTLAGGGSLFDGVTQTLKSVLVT